MEQREEYGDRASLRGLRTGATIPLRRGLGL
jgi:hypothetical protein